MLPILLFVLQSFFTAIPDQDHPPIEHPLPPTDYSIPTTDYPILTTSYPLPTTDYQLPTTHKIKGISMVAPPRPFTEDPMTEVLAHHVEWVAVIPFAYIRPGGTQVRYNVANFQWWGERPEGVEETLKKAKKNGLKVMLKPQVWIMGSWVGHMDFDREDEWTRWEDSYKAYLMEMLELAIKYEVEIFCIGTEFRISAVKREAFWRQLIEDIRCDYRGQLTYSSNWDHYQYIPFWDALDYVGISCYFPLDPAKTPNKRRLMNMWKPHVNTLREFTEKTKKKILFTEFGYLSVDGCAGKTWELEEKVRELAVNEEAQAIAIDALFSSFWNENFWQGGFLWKWFPNGMGHEGYPERDYTPQGKMASEVLKKWYNRS